MSKNKRAIISRSFLNDTSRQNKPESLSDLQPQIQGREESQGAFAASKDHLEGLIKIVGIVTAILYAVGLFIVNLNLSFYHAEAFSLARPQSVLAGLAWVYYTAIIATPVCIFIWASLTAKKRLRFVNSKRALALLGAILLAVTTSIWHEFLHTKQNPPHNNWIPITTFLFMLVQLMFFYGAYVFLPIFNVGFNFPTYVRHTSNGQSKLALASSSLSLSKLGLSYTQY